MKKYLYILCWCFVQCTLTCFAQSNLMAASDTIKLSEVTVSAERPLVQRKADRMIVSVEHSKMLKARSLSNILQLIPDVDYDGEGGISVMGNIFLLCVAMKLRTWRFFLKQPPNMMRKGVLQFLLSIDRRSMSMEFRVMLVASMNGKAEILSQNILD